MPSEFNAFSTEVSLAMEKIKNELRKDIRDGNDGTMREVRERLDRSEEERDRFYTQTGKMLANLETKIDTGVQLIRDVNGSVRKHKEILNGPDGTSGLVADSRSLLDSRTWVTVASGIVGTLIIAVWAIYGSDIKERGFLNRTLTEFNQIVDARVHKWFPKQPPPTDG